MLALIALANLPALLWNPAAGTEPGQVFVQHGETVADAVARDVLLVFVDMRAVPLFTLLFGYGMVQFARSRAARGVPPERVGRMLARRHLALLLFGAVHAALLFSGDVLGAYGLAGLVLTPLLFSRSRRSLLIVRAVLLGLAAVYALGTLIAGWALQGTDLVGDVAIPGLETETSWLGALGPRMAEWLFGTVGFFFLLPLIAALLTGWLWARAGVLDRPGEHLAMLRRTAAGGLAIAWAGGALAAACHEGLILGPEVGWALMGVQSVTGYFGGLGYAAVFGLIAARPGSDQGAAGRPLIGAVAAVGRRSLSAYLFQSLCFVPLTAAWGLGLGGRLGSAEALGIALAVWFVSVLWCVALERSGRRGPAEVLLRRLTYGRPRD